MATATLVPMLSYRWFLVTVLAVVLVACGGEDNEPSATIRTPTLPSEATETSTESPADNAPTEAPQATPEPTATPAVTDEHGAVILPCDDLLAPVDKQHRLPAECAPSDLVVLPADYSYGGEQLMRQEAAAAFIELREAAAQEGVVIYARSSYRSYDTQVYTYDFHVANSGQEYADRMSARPGHSEHQLGTTTDVVSASSGYELDPFVGTPEAAWIEENAWRFGFIVSYPEGMEDVTGYIYEPWHIRFVGTDIAAEVRDSGRTLGEYLHSLR